MSQENVEIVRRALQAWQRDDFDSWMAAIDPAMDHHTVLERLVEGTESFYRGHEGMRRLWHSYRTEFEDFEVEAQELRDLGGDRVLLLGRFRWRGPTSGIGTESPLGMVFTVRGGKMIRSVDYLSHAEALKAVGLEDETVPDENVALFHGGTAALNRGDVEYAVRHSTEDVVFIAARSAVEGRFVGEEGLRKFFADNAANFEIFQAHYDEVRKLDEHRVLAIGTIHIRGRGAGIETDVPVAGVATYREGKLSRWEDFRERRAALKAVGLEE